MKTSSINDIRSNNVVSLKLESLSTIPVHKFFFKDLSENLLSVHDLTSREKLYSGLSAKIFKDQNIVALYPKAESDPRGSPKFQILPKRSHPKFQVRTQCHQNLKIQVDLKNF